MSACHQSLQTLGISEIAVMIEENALEGKRNLLARCEGASSARQRRGLKEKNQPAVTGEILGEGFELTEAKRKENESVIAEGQLDTGEGGGTTVMTMISKIRKSKHSTTLPVYKLLARSAFHLLLPMVPWRYLEMVSNFTNRMHFLKKLSISELAWVEQGVCVWGGMRRVEGF